MFCRHCGHPCEPADAFCRLCGGAILVESGPSAPSKPSRIFLWLALAGVVAIGSVVLAVTVLSRRPPTTAHSGAEAPASLHFNLATASPSVLTLLCYDKDGQLTAQGSGFVVRRSGIAVTNWHVAEHAATMTATNGSGRVFTVNGYLNVDAGADLVLLQLANTDGSAVTDLAELHFADSRAVAAGQKVFTLSTPQGLAQTLSDGLLSAIRSVKEQQYLQISAPVSHGSSGGPVFNESGEVIGVIRGLLAGGENLNFAIPIDSVVRLLNAPAAVADQGAPGVTASTFERGLAAFNEKDYAVAASLFAQEVKANPQASEAAYNAGLAYLNGGDFGTATDYFQRFLALAEPDDDGIPVAKKWIAAYAASLIPEPTAPHAAADDEIVMGRNSSVYHRANCPLLRGFNVTTFKRSQIGSWASPCTTCRPDE